MQKIRYNNELIAVTINIKELTDVMTFITPNTFGIQVGHHNRKKGEDILPHEHIPFSNIKELKVQEMFYIIKGKVIIGLFYDNKKVKELILTENDLIVLNCGHELTFMEDTKMIEVKQGPYRGNEFEKRYIGKNDKNGK